MCIFCTHQIMRKTFNELVQEKSYNIQYNINDNIVVDVEDVIKLLQLCRLKTLEECANNALADWDWINNETDIEGYVLKESILTLDKNSIEI